MIFLPAGIYFIPTALEPKSVVVAGVKNNQKS